MTSEGGCHLHVCGLSSSIVGLRYGRGGNSEVRGQTIAIDYRVTSDVVENSFSPLTRVSGRLTGRMCLLCGHGKLSPSMVMSCSQRTCIRPISGIHLAFSGTLRTNVDSTSVFSRRLAALPVCPRRCIVFRIGCSRLSLVRVSRPAERDPV